MTFPTPCYWLCTSPRSGSSVLGDALTGTGVAGRPTEYFNSRFWPDLFGRFGVASSAALVSAVMRETASENGVVGVKMMLGADARPLFETLRSFSSRELSDGALVREVFPALKFVWLTRRHKVRQAVSYLRASQSGVWRRYRGEDADTEAAATFAFEPLDALVQELVLHEAAWQTFFDEAKARPFTVVYEDTIRDPEGTVRAILRFLGLEPPSGWSLGALPLEQLADGTSKAWVARYLEEKEASVP